MGTKKIVRETMQMPSIIIKRISESEFNNIESAWTKLLANSQANPLFMSWLWLHTWWKVFSKDNNYELLLLIAYTDDNNLIGIAPLYIENLSTFYGHVGRIQFLGNCWRSTDNIRSEYIDFICSKGKENEVLHAIMKYLHNLKGWDELVICNHWMDANTTPSIIKELKRNGYFHRIIEGGDTYAINIEGDFKNYLTQLSSKSRLKLYNQRRKLENHGKVECKKATEQDIDKYFDILNDFHKKRWNKSVFSGKRLEFHKLIAKSAAKKEQLDFDLLCVDGQPISILYDFVVNDVKYGNQLGFDQDYDKRISVNQLHFGYALENAFQAMNIKKYDFLRGTGRSGQAYKTNITKPNKHTATIHAVRNPVRKFLYRIYLIIPSPLATKIKCYLVKK
jgi:predicted N-acyltransferase